MGESQLMPVTTNKARSVWPLLILGLFVLSLGFMARQTWSRVHTLVPWSEVDLKSAAALTKAVGIGYIGGHFLGGLATDRFGAAKAIGTSFIISGLSTLLMIFKTDLGVDNILGIVSGLGIGFLFPACITLLNHEIKPRFLALTIALLLSLSSLAGLLMLELILKISSRWQPVLGISGSLILLTGILCIFLGKEKLWALEGRAFGPALKRLFHCRQFWWLLLAVLLGACATSLLSVMVRPYFYQYDPAPLNITGSYSLYQLGGLGSVVVISLAGYKFPDKILTMLFVCHLALPALIILWITVEPIVFKKIALAAAGLVVVCCSILYYLALVRIPGNEAVGTSIGLGCGLILVCPYVHPWFMSILASYDQAHSGGDWLWPFAVVIALSLGAALLFHRQIKTESP